MRRVTGVGGIFFKAKDAPALRAWYKRHLGIDVQEWGGTAFTWTDSDGKPTGGSTVWSVAPEEGDQFAPSKAPFMINYRVDDLHALIEALKAEGCNVLDKTDDNGIRQVRLGDRPRGKQGRAVATTRRSVKRAPASPEMWPNSRSNAPRR